MLLWHIAVGRTRQQVVRKIISRLVLVFIIQNVCGKHDFKSANVVYTSSVQVTKEMTDKFIIIPVHIQKSC